MIRYMTGLGFRSRVRGPSKLLSVRPSSVFSGSFTGDRWETSEGGILTKRTGIVRNNHYPINPLTGLRDTRAILLEGARTNLLTYSQELDNAAWSQTGAPTVTANTGTAPDGTTTADRIQFSGVQNVTQSIAVTSGTAYTISIWVRRHPTAGSDQTFRLMIHNGGSPDLTATSEWQRFTYTATAGSTASLKHGVIRDSAANPADIEVWGAVFEAAPFPSSYIQTPGSTVSRSADNAYVTGAPAPQALTVYQRFVEAGVASNNIAAYPWVITDGSNGNPSLHVDVAGNKYRMLHHNGTSSVTSSPATTPVAGELVELRCVLFEDGAIQAHISADEGFEVSGPKTSALTLAGSWSGDRLYFNSKVSNTGFASYYGLDIHPGELSMAECRSAF